MIPAPIPLLEQTLPPFTQGSAFSYLFNLTIAANLPNPSGWTACRLSLVAADGTVLSVSLPTVTISSTGSGPWVALITAPFTSVQTLAFPASAIKPVTFQLDFTAPGFETTLVGGTTFCLKPKRTYP